MSNSLVHCCWTTVFLLFLISWIKYDSFCSWKTQRMSSLYYNLNALSSSEDETRVSLTILPLTINVMLNEKDFENWFDSSNWLHLSLHGSSTQSGGMSYDRDWDRFIKMSHWPRRCSSWPTWTSFKDCLVNDKNTDLKSVCHSSHSGRQYLQKDLRFQGTSTKNFLSPHLQEENQRKDWNYRQK
jgi:hypothetical protein